jgi:hypothetical protein
VTETELQRAIIVALQKMGVWVIRTAVSRKRGRGLTGEPGMPDLCLPEYGWAEVKLPSNELQAEQVAWHDRARRRGIKVGTWRSVGEAVDQVLVWQTLARVRSAAPIDIDADPRGQLG